MACSSSMQRLHVNFHHQHSSQRPICKGQAPRSAPKGRSAKGKPRDQHPIGRSAKGKPRDLHPIGRNAVHGGWRVNECTHVLICKGQYPEICTEKADLQRANSEIERTCTRNHFQTVDWRRPNSTDKNPQRYGTTTSHYRARFRGCAPLQDTDHDMYSKANKTTEDESKGG